MLTKVSQARARTVKSSVMIHTSLSKVAWLQGGASVPELVGFLLHLFVSSFVCSFVNSFYHSVFHLVFLSVVISFFGMLFLYEF